MFKSNNLENKSYFTIKMGLFRNGRGISIQDIQAMSKPWTRDQRRGTLLYRKEEEVGRGCLQQRKSVGGKCACRVVTAFHWLTCGSLSLAGLLPGKEKNLPHSSWGGKVGTFLVGSHLS